MDVEFAKSTALLRTEIGQDQLDQIFVVWTIESRQQGTAAAGRQLDAPLAENPVQRRVVEPG